MGAVNMWNSDNKPIHSMYTNEFIQNLQVEVDKAIAKMANRENSNRKFDLGNKENKTIYFRLVDYKEVLDRILHCDECFKKYEAEDIVGIVKTLING